MLEWLKRHAWKACIPQKGISGSNPDLSARNGTAGSVAGCFFVDYADSAGCYTGKYVPDAPEGQPSARKTGVTLKARDSPRPSLEFESRFPLQ